MIEAEDIHRIDVPAPSPGPSGPSRHTLAYGTATFLMQLAALIAASAFALWCKQALEQAASGAERLWWWFLIVLSAGTGIFWLSPAGWREISKVNSGFKPWCAPLAGTSALLWVVGFFGPYLVGRIDGLVGENAIVNSTSDISGLWLFVNLLAGMVLFSIAFLFSLNTIDRSGTSEQQR